jgi:nickel transport protein
MINRIFLSALVIMSWAVTPLLAHEGWLEQRNGELMFYYGHGDKIDPYKPEYLKAAQAFDAKGGAAAAEIVKHEKHSSVATKGEPAIVTAIFDNGYWVKTTDGWKNIGKREAQGKYQVLLSDLSRKYAKIMLRPCEIYAKPLGLFLEIVPEKDPSACRPGDDFPIRVLLQGKPLEALPISVGTADHSQSTDALPRTDKDGRVTVKLEKPGLQLIATEHTMPNPGDPDADNLVACSSLTFTIK